jgi:hypothetical protein
LFKPIKEFLRINIKVIRNHRRPAGDNPKYHRRQAGDDLLDLKIKLSFKNNFDLDKYNYLSK